MKLFNHIKLKELDFDLESVTKESGRTYTTPRGDEYPSITTVLSKFTDKTFLIEWANRIGQEEANRITNKSKNRGTKLHSTLEKYLLNELTDFKIKTLIPDIKDFFNQLRPYIDENVGNVYGLEQALYSDKLKIAGRSDCIADWNNKLSIVDYKNSRSVKKEEHIDNYFVQCTAYAEMFEYITKRKVEQIVVLIANDEGVPQIFVKEKQKYEKKLYQIIEKYNQS